MSKGCTTAREIMPENGPHIVPASIDMPVEGVTTAVVAMASADLEAALVGVNLELASDLLAGATKALTGVAVAATAVFHRGADGVPTSGAVEGGGVTAFNAGGDW